MVGVGEDSHDLDFPSMEKLAYVYGYDYCACYSNAEIKDALAKAFAKEGSFICEVFVSKTQNFEPKSATKRLDDGTLVSAPLEDLAPFLDPEELKENMIIAPVGSF